MTYEAYSTVETIYWSHGGTNRHDQQLQIGQDNPAEMAFTASGRFYKGILRTPASGMLVLEVVAPRPLRLWVNGELALDESLPWRWYERELRATVMIPCFAGEVTLLAEIGERPTWPKSLDEDCPSRNREHVRAELLNRHPDRLHLTAIVAEDALAPAMSLRFLPAQFQRDGVVWQKILTRTIPGYDLTPPSIEARSLAEVPSTPISLSTAISPQKAVEMTSEEERAAGIHRYYVPVAGQHDMPAPLRTAGEVETRLEPEIEIARTISLTIDSASGSVTLAMPAFESLGRMAPQHEFREISWPSLEDARPLLPEPILPDRLSWIHELHDYSWEVLYRLVRHPQPDTGLPNAYIGTSDTAFLNNQFVWDSSFTAMCTAYGWRALPACATLDILYSSQFDGGYLHREHDTRDGMPAGFEPDFSPNPPLMSVAEWAIVNLTGDIERLTHVYPALKAIHIWIKTNRRLPDGTYWTTGLANGLDNSPSLGDGYPDLTAQMAHDAEVLGKMARTLGMIEEAEAWESEISEIGTALNERLWSDEQQIYSTSLPDGGHNTNKVITAFWPMWADIVPAERVAALARHMKDPSSFWRHHPFPSLAADSPYFQPGGQYWMGSVWAPTNYAAIKGIARAGRQDLAREASLRHLQCMHEVWRETGHIWENYCSERSERGNWSCPDYSWTTLGPIALLYEVIIGLEADALHNQLHWKLPDEERIGVRRFPLGAATIRLECIRTATERILTVDCDQPFTLNVELPGQQIAYECPAGHSEHRILKS